MTFLLNAVVKLLRGGGPLILHLCRIKLGFDCRVLLALAASKLSKMDKINKRKYVIRTRCLKRNCLNQLYTSSLLPTL